MQLVAEVKLATGSGLTSLSHVLVALHHIMVAKLYDRDKALQTSIHVAVKCVVLEAHDAVFEFWHSTIVFDTLTFLLLSSLLLVLIVSSALRRRLSLLSFLFFFIII